MDEEWKAFKDAFVGVAEELCGRTSGKGGHHQEVAKAIREKREIWKMIEGIKENGEQPNYSACMDRRKVKVRSYIAWYPVRRTAQSALHRPVHSKTISTYLGSIQACCNCAKTIRLHFHHCLYCQVLIYTAE